VEIAPEQPDDAPAIEHLLDLAFGTDRMGKTVYKLRDGIAPAGELGFVIRDTDGSHTNPIRGSLRFWPIAIGETRVPALLLGPIAVAPEDRGKGYAKALIWHGLGVARALGHRIVLLVGDAPYYEQFGFTRALAVELSLPGWVDEARFLGLELVPGALAGVRGLVDRAE
jgi:predicted N-acetyltransferase YhbS